MNRAVMGERPSAPFNESVLHRSAGSIAKSNPADALIQPSAANVGGAATVYSRPASSAGEHAAAFGPAQESDDRRVAWLERGQLPSFEFKSKDDEHVLKVIADQQNDAPRGAVAASVLNEETRRLAGIAADIQKIIEGDVASIFKELMGVQAMESPASSAVSAVSEARNAFSHFMKCLHNAKLAAGDGAHAQFKEQLTLALGKLDSFTATCVGPKASNPLKFNDTLPPVRATLARLGSLCRTWGGIAEAPSVDGSPVRIDSEARSRSVSSPEPASRKTTASVQMQGSFSGSSSPGKKSSGRKAPGDPAKTVSPTTTAGRKLKALFARSSESPARKADERELDTAPGSPSNRSRSKTATARSDSTASMPERVARSRDNTVSSPIKSPRRTETSGD
jgi:hypothetical protein